MNRLIAVCVSPAIDRSYTLDHLIPGTLHRAAGAVVTAGGKGVNVARVLAQMGEKPLLLGFAAGANGWFLRRSMAEVGVQCQLTEVAGETRTTMNLLDCSSGRETEITEAGPFVDDYPMNQFLYHFEDSVEKGDTVVMAGGLPPGLPTDFYARLIRIARSKGARCLLDSSGEALQEALLEKPDLVKPNLRELSHLCGHPVRTRQEAVLAVHELEIPLAVVSMGAQGAILVEPDQAWHARALPIVVTSTIGSGDSLTAGLAIAMHRGMISKKALALGTACAASNAVRPDVGSVDRQQVEDLYLAVRVRKVPTRSRKR